MRDRKGRAEDQIAQKEDLQLLPQDNCQYGFITPAVIYSALYEIKDNNALKLPCDEDKKR